MTTNEEAVAAVREMMGAIHAMSDKIDHLETAQKRMISIFEDAAKRLGF